MVSHVVGVVVGYTARAVVVRTTATVMGRSMSGHCHGPSVSASSRQRYSIFHVSRFPVNSATVHCELKKPKHYTSVSMLLRCDGTFNYDFIAYLLVNLSFCH